MHSKLVMKLPVTFEAVKQFVSLVYKYFLVVVATQSKKKAQGKIRTLITSLAMSFVVFMISVGIGAAVVSQDNSTDIKAKASATGSAKKKKSNVYKCDNFDAATRTQQGTKHDSGFYSYKDILIE